ncbi:MAG: DUF1801 domain-containing protein [Thermoplasmata archaeon]
MKPSAEIDRLIAETTDWRGRTLTTIRRVMRAADPQVTEEWKWMGTPVWELEGIIAIANPHQGKVKVTFPQGAHLSDPDKLFNAGLGGNLWRAIDLFETDRVDEKALLRLVRSAIELNRSRAKPSRSSERGKRPKVAASRR